MARHCRYWLQNVAGARCSIVARAAIVSALAIIVVEDVAVPVAVVVVSSFTSAGSSPGRRSVSKRGRAILSRHGTKTDEPGDEGFPRATGQRKAKKGKENKTTRSAGAQKESRELCQGKM
ncbi:uncharacterized protein SPSK_10428 [Sporothrix schenckii 1099-18]|uniref:Uncharacterized protein n=1 Tax=Sporothrix schenckii 1099-18 TaxID=1397361 RepID=A0A0F2MCA2_SPOSC|nr:uncharacterized protein SPSK_10428 [Sporothrix schenckii 1099-18]KJR87338.1 hypothetical protein SPSK_10428 [Sporothrix schenckii 1099-18]